MMQARLSRCPRPMNSSVISDGIQLPSGASGRVSTRTFCTSFFLPLGIEVPRSLRDLAEVVIVELQSRGTLQGLDDPASRHGRRLLRLRCAVANSGGLR